MFSKSSTKTLVLSWKIVWLKKKYNSKKNFGGCIAEQYHMYGNSDWKYT